MPGPGRREGTHYEVVEGRAIIVDASGTELITLNRVGTVVWESLDGGRDVNALTDEVATRFPDVARDELGRDVRQFLAELGRAKLIQG